MAPGSTDPSVLLLGSADLAVTATVAALLTRDLTAEWLPSRDQNVVLRELGRRSPGVLILDLDRWNATTTIKQAAGDGWTVVALGAEKDRERVAGAVAAGAADWVPKSASFETLVGVVRAALAGRPQMLEAERTEWLSLHRATQSVLADQVSRLLQLSAREREVLRHMVEGRRAAETGALLFLSVATVRTHIRSILVKLEVNSQARAVEIYQETVRRLPAFAKKPVRSA